jgi:hypothetical protein
LDRKMLPLVENPLNVMLEYELSQSPEV